MHLCYFDENKHSPDNPYFFIGGLLIPDSKALEFEKTLAQIAFNFFGSSSLTVHNEFHGKELFHGKGIAKGRKMEDRVQVFRDVANFVTCNQIPVRLVCINVDRHRSKYAYPMPAYRLGLMLILERYCEYLDKVDDLGLVFGDYEADEVTSAVVDFSEYKSQGKTPMYSGRPLGRLLDTVYFTHSHHSRFLQVADLLVYMAGRYENMQSAPDKWHEKEVAAAWEKIKASGNVYIQRWP
ncbi:DUF3800 domain-containing protein [Methylomonas sp. ZR1]|uniref:DUF3800 domain-containing protein n=1 Tax=Methylomonas sp. ZR1 TaxID=1797072 RepID=UPI001490D21A|nr:DUF3800 domain-containing protein [Methylomonas sp. ZR1]NOV30637.1 DUF3800 domain-containing protein [Methylomonas sp. ZR1]